MTVLILDDGLAKENHPRHGQHLLKAGRNRSEDLYDELVSKDVEVLLYDGRAADEVTEILDPSEAARELLRRVRSRFNTVPLSIRRVIVWSVRVGNQEIDHFCGRCNVQESDMLDRGKVDYKAVARRLVDGRSLPDIIDCREVDIVLDLIWFGDIEYGEALLEVLI